MILHRAPDGPKSALPQSIKTVSLKPTPCHILPNFLSQIHVLPFLGVIQIIRDTRKCQSVTQTVLTFLLMLFLDVTSNTQVQYFVLKHTLSLLKDFTPKKSYLKETKCLMGGSEKCQKSVTYYLNGPFMHLIPLYLFLIN